MLRKPTSVAALAALSLCLLAALPQPAPASFPGRPGMIVFNLTDRSTGAGGLHPRGELWGIQPWQAEPHQLTWNPYDSDPSFAPSGRRFAFLRSSPVRPGIYEYDLASGGVARIIGGTSLLSPAFGRRGMVAYTRATPIGRDLFIRAADGRNHRLSATPGTNEEEPVFTPNGKRIVFLRRTGSFGTLEIWWIGVDGEDARRLDATPYLHRPDIAPNGHWLATQTLRGIGTAHRLGTSVIQRSLHSDRSNPGFYSAAYPVYSPGGGKIAFSNFEGIWIAPVGATRNSETLVYRTWDPESRSAPYSWPHDLAWQPLPRK